MKKEKTYSVFTGASIDGEVLVIDYINSDGESKKIEFVLVKAKDRETTQDVFNTIIELLNQSNGWAMHKLYQLQEKGIIISKFDKEGALMEKIEELSA